MRGLIALTLCAALAGCSSPMATGPRDAAIPMRAMATVDTNAFSGRWWEVATYLPDGASCVIGGLTVSPQPDGNLTLTEGPCADGRPRTGLATRTGPGRYLFGGEELWLLWADFEYSVAVIATDAGRAHILARSLTPPADKLAAAREILDWNGFDVSTLAAARRR